MLVQRRRYECTPTVLEATQGANIRSISHRCYLREVSSEWELTKETVYLPLGCLQGGETVSQKWFESRLTPASAAISTSFIIPAASCSVCRGGDRSVLATVETTQGQIAGFFSQLPFKCYLTEVTSVGD